MATPTPMASGGFSIGEEYGNMQLEDLAPVQAPGDLPDLKPEDRYQRPHDVLLFLIVFSCSPVLSLRKF